MTPFLYIAVALETGLMSQAPSEQVSFSPLSFLYLFYASLNLVARTSGNGEQLYFHFFIMCGEVSSEDSRKKDLQKNILRAIFCFRRLRKHPICLRI